MLKQDTKVKVGIYQSGSHVRVLGECDLITQDNGHKDEAIYLVEVCVMRDPRNEWTESEQDKIIQNMINNFRTSNFQFKAKDRTEADLFIKSKLTSSWEPVREMAEV
jgi:Holliday junction resolvase-like predicted endonuclease